MTAHLRKRAVARPPTQLISMRCREEPGRHTGCAEHWPSGHSGLSAPRCGRWAKGRVLAARPERGSGGGSPRAPLSVGRRKGEERYQSSKRIKSKAVRAKEGSAAGFRRPLPSTFGTRGLRKGGEGARRPVPAFPVLSGAVFGGRNGSCCGKKPPVLCCCSAEPKLWEPLPPRQAPPPLSDAPAPLRGAAPSRPRHRPAPGARSKLSDMIGPGSLRRSREGASNSVPLRRGLSPSLSVSTPHAPPR